MNEGNPYKSSVRCTERAPLNWLILKPLLRRGASCVITSHYSPDGDAIGSELALALFIKQIGAVPHIINQSPVPRIYEFLDESGLAKVYTEADDELIMNADVLFVLDASTWDRIGTPAKVMQATGARRVCIDHHATNDGIADIDMIDPTEAAAAMLVYDMIIALGGRITPAIARALFVGIGTDTGWFRFSNTSARVFDVAAELARKGAVPAELHSRIYEQLRWERMALLARGFSHLHSAADGKIAWMTLTRRMFSEAAADDEDVEGIVDLIRTVAGVEIVLLFREAAGGMVRVSLRSKGHADVGRLAEQFGGGGHARAAGIRMPGTLDDVIDKVIRAAEQELAISRIR